MDSPKMNIMQRKLLAIFDAEPDVKQELRKWLVARPENNAATRLLRHIAPLVRRRRLQCAQPTECLAGLPIQSLRGLFLWLDLSDPESALILDLRYFARLNINDISAIIKLEPEEVRRRIARQKAYLWVHARR